MKLLLCCHCQDVFKLSDHQERSCKCGLTKGQYDEDGLNAWYSGKFAIPLGFANVSLRDAVLNRPESGWGEPFTAFVIEKDCPTFRKVD